jgi:hypothetical protein
MTGQVNTVVLICFDTHVEVPKKPFHKTKMKIYTHYPNGCLGQNKII